MWKLNLQNVFFVLLLIFNGIAGCATSPWRQEQADNHLNIASAYMASGQYTAALKELIEAEKFSPRDHRIHYYLGLTYYAKDLQENAMDELKRSLDLKPDYSEAHNFLGTVYLNMSLWDKAIESFNKALSNPLYDTPAVSLYNMGRAYYKKGDYQAAVDKYGEAIKKNQNASVPLALIELHIGMVNYAQGDMDKAIEHFDRSLSLAPSLVESQYWLGQCYAKLGKKTEAIMAYQAVIKMAPESEFSAKAKENLSAL